MPLAGEEHTNMAVTIALAGNPNSGKTTMFNALTGANQFVGNWPGVTVEKKTGKLKGEKEAQITDLPGIYSLSPYTLEEVVSRNYLIDERPDVILDIVDASNIERNLYLTTQLLETGIPVVIALNMMDVVRKNGDKIDTAKLAGMMNCEVAETAAAKNQGCMEAAQLAVKTAGSLHDAPRIFEGRLENAISGIEGLIEGRVSETRLRWYAIKLFERDEQVMKAVKFPAEILEKIEAITARCEDEMDDDAESLITDGRYEYINRVVNACVKKGRRGLTPSDKIDRIVTNRILALPIFAVVMFLIYFISVTTLGGILTDWTNDTLFGEWIIPGVEEFLSNIGTAGWLTGLVVEGIISGVGAVLGFVPQMLVLFLMLCVLEDIGYMARIAFIMDRIFRRFGLSGKSFIPMLIGLGCGVPGVMASRTIEQDRDRKMTIMTTTFVPCGAKVPIIGLIAGALFGGAWWVAPSAYFAGFGAIIVSGIILKKTKRFAGEPAPFVMELPPYHVPKAVNVLRGTWERGWSFIKRAGTVILLASVAIWFTSSYGWAGGAFGGVEDMDNSILGVIGRNIKFIFSPLGFGEHWEATVATILGLVAKEEVVGAMGTMAAVAGDALTLVEEGEFAGVMAIAAFFPSMLAAYSFLIFNLLCAPCFAAIGAIKREMNNSGWTWFAIGYQTIFAYTIALIVYQLGALFTGGGFGIWTAAAIILLAVYIWLLARKGYKPQGPQLRAVEAKTAVR